MDYLWPDGIENLTGHQREREEKEDCSRTEPRDCGLGCSRELICSVVLLENTKGIQKADRAEQGGECANYDEPRSGAAPGFSGILQIMGGCPNVYSLDVVPASDILGECRSTIIQEDCLRLKLKDE